MSLVKTPRSRDAIKHPTSRKPQRLPRHLVDAVSATPLMFTTILSQAPQGRIGQLMGLGTLSLGAAPALGPTLGGAVQTVAGWRAILWGVIPVAVVALCVGIRCIRQVTPTSHPPLRMGQLVTLTGAQVGLLLGVERVGAALSSPSVEGSSVVFAVGACASVLSL